MNILYKPMTENEQYELLRKAWSVIDANYSSTASPTMLQKAFDDLRRLLNDLNKRK
jgi:hypothetical protein